jgi:hypothetical protein
MFPAVINTFDVIALIVAIIVTIYVSTAKNPHIKGSDSYNALKFCRIGLAFLVWSFDFGIIGFGFALVAFIFGIIGIVKGNVQYGVVVVIGAVAMPLISIYYNIHKIIS